MNIKKIVVASSLVAVASVSQAAIDISSTVTTMQTDGTAALTTVGTALIALAGVAVVFKWAKAAFF